MFSYLYETYIVPSFESRRERLTGEGFIRQLHAGRRVFRCVDIDGTLEIRDSKIDGDLQIFNISVNGDLIIDGLIVHGSCSLSAYRATGQVMIKNIRTV